MGIIYHRKRRKVGSNSYQNLRSDGSIQSTTTKHGNNTTTIRSDGTVRQTFNSGHGWSSVQDSRSGRKRKAGNDQSGDLLVSLAVMLIVFFFKLAWNIVSGIVKLIFRLFKR